MVSLSSVLTEADKTYKAEVESPANKIVEYNSIDVRDSLRIGWWYQLTIRGNKIIKAVPIADLNK